MCAEGLLCLNRDLRYVRSRVRLRAVVSKRRCLLVVGGIFSFSGFRVFFQASAAHMSKGVEGGFGVF